MCQPHQLWIFPDFARGFQDGDGESESRQRLQKAMVAEGAIGEEEDQYLQHNHHLHEAVGRYHSMRVTGNQCRSMVVKRVGAPVSTVWSMVRRFDCPQRYKRFIHHCSMQGDGNVGSTRHVRVISGLPAATSTERLEILDENRHIISFRVVDGDHRLQNYRSITTLHDCPVNGRPGTIVIESYVVDVPSGNNREETCLFADTIVRCNLQSLARMSEHSASTI